MSLIITSNETNDGGNAPVNVGINRPFDYINNFSQPLEIPPNSKIAVQSVKINKEGGIQINQANAQFGIYFGDKSPNADGTVTLDYRTETVKYSRLNYWGNKNQIFTIDEFAKQLQTAYNNALFNPALQKSALTGGGATVTVQRNGTTNDFEGYATIFNQSINACLTNNISDMGFVDACSGEEYVGGGTWDGGAGTITQDDASGLCEMVGAGGPVSNQEGVFKVDFLNAGFGWIIGLSRYQDNGQLTINDMLPNYYANRGLLNGFYDYAVASVQDPTDSKYYLRVYHCCAGPSNFRMIFDEEFEYWNNGVPATVAALSGPIEVFSTAGEYALANISKVSFKISNEKIVLDVSSRPVTMPGSEVVYTLANGAQAGKTDNLKPCCATTRYLYPKVFMPGVSYGMYLTVETANIDPPDDFVYGDKRNSAGAYPLRQPSVPNDHDWFCKLYWTMGQNYGQEVDMRYMMDMYDSTGGPSGDGTYTQHGINASGGLAGDLVLCVQDDEKQGWKPTKQFNAGDLLGFADYSTVDASTKVNLIQTFDSTTIPKMVSTNSMFIRLNNFTQTSFNCMTGSPSKILYHLPRFTNSGEEFGGLFFEPTEKVYVSLNNPSPLVINDLSISIVNVNETLANNLTGKTVVCFHLIT